MDWASILKKARLKKGMTQKELADLLGCEFSAVSKWECGTSVPKLRVLEEVARILNVKFVIK